MPQDATDPLLTIWTYDWVPQMPRGKVRDVRLRWALEEAGLPYRVATVPFEDRGPEHLARQPFAQVPFLQDGEVRLFESGACLLHIAGKSEALMPGDPVGRAEVLEWVIAALNSIEMVTVPWWFVKMSGAEQNPLSGWMEQRFERLDAVLSSRDWLAAGRFTAADILMADVLRLPDELGRVGHHPALRDYVERACARPAFGKAVADQMAHFEASDAGRG
ncbi:glutathione S-transferase family protein [Pseudooceanicola sp.]|uniref:glutathione S-transferase family protein n=1 Tax=Pseudooceanicola sp. TaxID=1914328 RepID=UPI003516AAE1